MGPDLTHLGARQTLAAGVVPNTAGSLEAWISDPQGMKPGSDMPRMAVSPQEMPALVAYLESLK
jgi:cytochrome c oxidase subunit 2